MKLTRAWSCGHLYSLFQKSLIQIISRMRNLSFLSERIFLHLWNRRWSAHAEAQRSMALFPAHNLKCSEKRPRDASSINRPRYLFLFTLAADKLIHRRSDLKWIRSFIFSFVSILVWFFHFWNEEVFSFLCCHLVPRSVVRFCRSLNDIAILT